MGTEPLFHSRPGPPITARHLTPTLAVVVLAAAGSHLVTSSDEHDAAPYPLAPTGIPIDGDYHPCRGPGPAGYVSLVCSVNYGDAP